MLTFENEDIGCSIADVHINVYVCIFIDYSSTRLKIIGLQGSIDYAEQYTFGNISCIGWKGHTVIFDMEYPVHPAWHAEK